jgi:hypothetical protein
LHRPREGRGRKDLASHANEAGFWETAVAPADGALIAGRAL